MIKNINTYILIPIILPVFFFAVALSPVEILGCLGRGLLASFIAMASLFLSLFLSLKQLKIKMTGGKDDKMWILSSLILIIPAAGLILLA